MAWLLSSPQINSAFASLGRYEGDTYIVNDDCLKTLECLITRITMEDYTVRPMRRSMGFSQHIQNDLVPLLIHTNDQRVFERTVKFLELLTIPVECLLSVDLMEKTDVGRTTMYELNQLLIKCKASLVDLKCIAAITDYMNGILEKNSSYSSEQCDNILNCLTLIRNIMYIPEENDSTVLQKQLLWNLFFKNFGKLLIHLQTCSQRSYWSVAMVELTALMYKDQHVSTLQRLLRASFEDSMNESSEDNESNTTMPINRSMDSSPLLTSSDSSDNGGRRNKMNEDGGKETNTTKSSSHTKHIYAYQQSDNMSCSDESNAPNSQKKSEKCPQHQNSTDMSDCGYGTQVDTPENQCTSSSSNDDDNMQHQVHHKPPQNQKQRHNPANKAVDSQNKQELRKKRLLKRAKTNIIKVKGLFHQPTEADISNVLKDFTVDFLIKGYNNLVKELHSHLLTDVVGANQSGVRMDASHFYWMITYFLKFATLLELDLSHISSVLNYDIVGFMVYEAVNVCEQLESATKLEDTDLKRCLRLMHLIVTAIREFLEAIDKYSSVANLRKEDQDYLHNLQLELDATEDLRCLFVLLLRCYNPKLHSKEYLTDLITTNHKLLVMLDGVSKTSKGKLHLNMIEHIRQFASVEIMYQYGFLLENFKNNGEYINDCIFTMMHHVSGDLSQIAMLFQPHILKTFSKIWDSDYEVCDDWLDLIKYVIYKFTNTTPQQSPLPIPNVLCATIAELTAETTKKVTWTFDEMDTLFWYYAQSKKTSDPLGNVVGLLKKNGDSEKTRKDVLEQLLKQDIIEKEEFKALSKTLCGGPPKSHTTTCDSTDNKPVDDIQILVRRLLGDTKGKLLTWLQKVLMECCFVKLRLNAIIGNTSSPLHTVIVAEPMTYHSQLKNHSVPLVAWNMDQLNSMSYKPFVMLLHKLGFILPTATKMMFVRIPNFWSIRNMHDIALELGPIDKSLLKFDVSLINQKCDLFDDNFNRQMHISSTEEEIKLDKALKRSKSIESFEIQTAHKSHSLVNSTPHVTSSSKNYLDVAGKSKGETRTKISEAVKVNTRSAATTELSVTKTSLRAEQSQDKLLARSQFTTVHHDSIEECDEVEVTGDALSDCESVASDLMYVSDEEDANDFRAYLMEDVNEFFNK